MNITTLIFFSACAAVALWIAADYIPAISNIFSSLPNLFKGSTKQFEAVENSKGDILKEDPLVELTKGYVNLRKQLKETGNDVGLKALDAVFPTLNRDIVNNK